MKFWLLILILFFATNLIQNAESVDERGPKLYKSFDEIFGKGWNDESNDSKDLNCRHVKEEDQDGQAPNTSDQKNIDEILKQKFDEYDENWEENENNSVPDQDESVDVHQNDSNEFETIESNQQKREIIQKFREMKEYYKKNRKYSRNEWNQIEAKISNGLGVGRSLLFKWIKELGLNQETKFKSKFSELEKRQILKQFDEIKTKCKKAKLKNILKNELDKKIAKKLGVCSGTIFKWKRKFGLSVGNKKFSELEKRIILKQFDEIKNKCKKAKLKNILISELDEKISKKLGVCRRTLYKWKRKFGLSVSNKISDATKIGILKKYAKIKGKNSKMTNAVIADMLNISSRSLCKWKQQFKDEINNL